MPANAGVDIRWKFVAAAAEAEATSTMTGRKCMMITCLNEEE
jgi:hypothetical protein